MSGSLPTTPGFATVGLKSKHSTLRSEMQSGRRQVRKFGGHKWMMTAKYPSMTRSEFMPIYAFMVKQEGMYGSFTVIPPDLATPQGTATGTPLVGGIHAVGDNTIKIDGFTGGVTSILKAGDIMKFASHDKVYMVVSDANTGAGDGNLLKEDGGVILKEDSGSVALESGGTTTVTIEPPLVSALANSEVVTVTNVAFTMEMTGDIQAYNVNAPSIYSFELDLTEILGG